MADVIPHFCTGTGCEALHGSGGQNPDVQIAKINADRDIEVARIGRTETKTWAEADVAAAEVQAAAVVEATAIQAEAAVDEAVVENEVLEEVVNPEPEPVVVVQQDAGAGEDEEAVTPPEIAHVSEESNSSGFWDKYR